MGESMTFNDQLARKLQGLKKDIGAKAVRQGYRGTGSRSDRRQIFVSDIPKLGNSTNAVIDLWLEDDRVELGGVCMTRYGKVSHNGRTVDEVYAEIVQKLGG